jgi:diaminohydroxyphosphoribosylaminopyrimidine deaminase/5-amino-6-(5-phosphoribosylamino)uracil reductase
MGSVAPNPLVGAVLVHQNKIIGEGFHTAYGNPHAEVEAIRSVPEKLKHIIPQSTLYVNLEPCSHYGKTPPCADFIIQNNIRRVVIGQADPNPLVSGKGISILKQSGVEIIQDVLHKECTFLNRRFNTYQIKQRPYIILKWAQTADGFVASLKGKRETISDETSHSLSHLWRSQEQAIMIGYRTALLDNPTLTTRLVPGKNPVRIVLDYEYSLPRHLNIFNDQSSTIVFSKVKANAPNHYQIPEENNLHELMKQLFNLQISSVIVEGGAKLHRLFIENNLWDEARVFHSKKHLQMSGIQAASLPLKSSEIIPLNNDTLHIYYNS